MTAPKDWGEAQARARETGEPVNRARTPIAIRKTANDTSGLDLAARHVSASGDWYTVAPDPREHLLDDTRTHKGAVAAHGVALLVGAGGVSKSFATLALAYAVSSNGTWLGTFQVAQPGPVLVVSYEDPTDEVRRRVYYIAGGKAPEHPIDVLDLHDAYAPMLDPNARPTHEAEAIVAHVRERGPYRLVIVDPLARCSGASIDADNVAAGALVTTLERISSAAGGLVLGVHHTDKSARREKREDATVVRGATALADSARAVLTLTARTPEVARLALAKANHVARWEPVTLRRGEHGVLVALDPAELPTVAAEANGEAERVRRKLAAEEERRKVRAARAAEEAERKATAKRKADLARREQDAADADAAREITASGYSGKLRLAVMARLHCGPTRADKAIERVRLDDATKGGAA